MSQNQDLMRSKRVPFTAAQLEYLEQRFQNLPTTPTMQMQDIMYRAGQQNVLQAIRDLVRPEQVGYNRRTASADS